MARARAAKKTTFAIALSLVEFGGSNFIEGRFIAVTDITICRVGEGFANHTSINHPNFGLAGWESHGFPDFRAKFASC
jgi:hypothetical protein